MLFRSGVGMPPEFLAHLFTPFSQAHGTTVRNFSGSGLGMAIAKRLGDLLGAELTVRSTVAVGTVMTICVPLAPSAVERTAA